MNKEDLPIFAASVDVGVLADRTLFLFAVKDDEGFTDEDRRLLLENAQLLRRLFLETPEELVLSGNASCLASSRSGWYETLVEAAPKGRRTGESPLKEWVTAAVDAAKTMAEGAKVKQSQRESLVTLLDALSSATFVFAERAQSEPRFGGTEWSRPSTTLG